MVLATTTQSEKEEEVARNNKCEISAVTKVQQKAWHERAKEVEKKLKYFIRQN